MNISQVFRNNLRQLTNNAGNVSETARILDINRAQYNRYLSGESYPKPAVLDRICKYFGVDARILTDLLDEQVLQDLPEPGLHNEPNVQSHYWEHAARWLPENYFEAPGSRQIEDGLYLYWRPSMAQQGSYICTPAQIGTSYSIRTFRMYGVKSPVMMSHTLLPKQREIRGILMGQDQGISIFLPPNRTSTMSITIFLNNSRTNSAVFLSGTVMLARENYADYGNFARCLLQRLPAEPASIVKASRYHRYFTRDELPDEIVPLLTENKY